MSDDHIGDANEMMPASEPEALKIDAKATFAAFRHINRTMAEMDKIMKTEPEALKACPSGPECPACGYVRRTRPAEDRRADDVYCPDCGSLITLKSHKCDCFRDLGFQRDALKAQIERLTSDDAVEAVVVEWRKYIKSEPTFRLKLWAKAAITEALRAAGVVYSPRDIEMGER